MPDRVEFALNAEEMMNAFSRLKNVPLDTVTRNATRDFVRYARKNTPLAEPVLPRLAGPSADPHKALYYRFRNYHKDNKISYVPVAVFAHKTRAMLRKMQAVKVGISRGWLRTVWIAVGVHLGIDWSPPAGRKRRKTLDLTWAKAIKARDVKGMELSAKIPAPKYLPRYMPGYWERIHRGGFEYAAGIMIRELDKILRSAWNAKATLTKSYSQGS